MTDASADYEDSSNSARVIAKAPPRPAFTEPETPPAVNSTRVTTLERRGAPVTLDDLRDFIAAAADLPGDAVLGIYAVHEHRGEPSLVQIRVEA